MKRLLLVLALLFLPGVHAYNSVNDGLIFNATMQEGTGSLVTDFAGTANLTLIGGTWSPGNLPGSNATTYNGTGAFATSGSDINALDVGAGAAWTWHIRFKMPSGYSCAGDKYIMSKMPASGSPGWALYSAAGCPVRMITGNSSGALELSDGGAYDDGNWHSVFIRRDNTTSPLFTLRIRTDRVDRANGTTTSSMGDLSNTIPIAIAATNNGSAQFLNVTVQFAKMWNRYLNESEMRTIDDAEEQIITVNITSPTNRTYNYSDNIWTNTSIVWLNLTASDNSGNVTFQLDDTTNYSATNSSGNWNYRLNLTNLSIGAHNIRAFVNNSAGTMNSTQIVYFTFTPGFLVPVKVYRGWNLITVYENATLYNISNWTAAPTNITVVQCFNSTSQSWAKYNWTNGTGNSSYVCSKGAAVFVLIGRNDSLNLTGDYNEWNSSTGGNWTVNRSIYVGYNYLGVPGNVSLLNASNWTSSFRFVSCWNASKQEYFTYLNRSIFAGGTHNTSLCIEGTGIMLYSLVNETVTLKAGADSTLTPVFAAVLFLAGGAWLFRWYSRRGQT